MAAVCAFAIASLFGSPYPDLAVLQNLPTLLAVAILFVALARWPLDNVAVACLCAFLALHTLGGRYAYSYVPYDSWAASIGLARPSAVFGWDRNNYDRLVHFAFGALATPPLRAALGRYLNLRGRAVVWLPFEFVLAFSAAYEIFEWLLTILMAGPAADEYNGQQGDIWDAQKDMALAALGSALSSAMILTTTSRRARSGSAPPPAPRR